MERTAATFAELIGSEILTPAQWNGGKRREDPRFHGTKQLMLAVLVDALQCVRGYKGLDVGDHVAVELVSTNVERGFVDFARIERS
jgi:hypothetical protein